MIRTRTGWMLLPLVRRRQAQAQCTNVEGGAGQYGLCSRCGATATPCRVPRGCRGAASLPLPPGTGVRFSLTWRRAALKLSVLLLATMVHSLALPALGGARRHAHFTCFPLPTLHAPMTAMPDDACGAITRYHVRVVVCCYHARVLACMGRVPCHVACRCRLSCRLSRPERGPLQIPLSTREVIRYL